MKPYIVESTCYHILQLKSRMVVGVEMSTELLSNFTTDFLGYLLGARMLNDWHHRTLQRQEKRAVLYISLSGGKIVVL